MNFKRVLYFVVSAVFAVSASLFAGNVVKAMKSEVEKESLKQLVLTQGSDLFSGDDLLADHYSHSSHRSHSSHSSHRSHSSHYSSR
jgi:hypothetical protein